mgnify:CR=1 FL=1
MKDKIFHQIVRYEYAKCAVNAMRKEKRHCILEVGSGSHGNLAKYLPDDDITFLDSNLPEDVLNDPRFVLGDATSLPYAAESFDIVIALDVLEHIPEEKRQLCIANLHRVARLGVILSVPHYCAKDRYEDELLKAFYILCGIDPPVWIDEHIECVLPKEEELLHAIKKQGVSDNSILKIYGVKRSLMAKMLYFEAIASKYNEVLKFFDVMNSDYVDDFLYQDMALTRDEAMKLYVIWKKDGTIEEVQNTIAERFSPNRHLVNTFENKYSELIGWILNLETLDYCTKLLSETNKNSSMLEILLDNQFPFRLEAGLNGLYKLAENLEKRLDDLISEKKKTRLNIILITYNHADFIRETLESILMQETTFNFNILVADDCSTDNTVSIIREIETTTSIPFIYLPNDHNLGIMKNYQRAFAACDAEYVAIIEGDDLWTDKLRLQKHVEFLNQHSECSMSFNRYIVRNYIDDTSVMQPRFSAAEEMLYYRYVSGHDLAYNNLIGNFSTSVYRLSALKALPDQMFSMKGYDWLTNILVSKTGFIGCLMQPMSIYRIHDKGTWSRQDQREKLQSVLDVIEIYDSYTNREFTAGFTAHKQRLEAALLGSNLPAKDSQKLYDYAKNVLRTIYRFSNYLPPICVHIVGLFIPNIIKSKINSIL